MVCSFIKQEAEDQINNFTKKHGNFKILDFNLTSQNIKFSKLINNNFMKTYPETIMNYNIDGYFAAYLKKMK